MIYFLNLPLNVFMVCPPTTLLVATYIVAQYFIIY